VTTSNALPTDLIGLVATMEQSFQAGVRGQLQWLENAALALDAADLGPAGKDSARNLKAAMGAILTFAQKTREKTPEQNAIAEMQAVVRTLLAHGVLSLYRALADNLRALATAQTPQQAACLELAAIFDELARATEHGTPPSPSVLLRLDKARAALDKV
jgi:hypothetical protein